MRAIRNTARRGSRDPSIANERRSIFNLYQFSFCSCDPIVPLPCVTSIRYQSLKREYLIRFHVERGIVLLSCENSPKASISVFLPLRQGKKKRGGIEETMGSMNAKRRTVFSFSLSLSVSFSLTSHSLFVVIRKKSKRIDRNARNDSFLVPFFSSSSFSSIILTEASSKSVTRVPGRFRTARPTRVYAWCNV